ncbi:MAG TPA: HEAT repeat domain-containing protein [bacterium]|nr:HEAT repeat domain-containing protein [bacterium]HQP99301.1 HEAT repeat domain-containing protein [bacterium]
MIPKSPISSPSGGNLIPVGPQIPKRWWTVLAFLPVVAIGTLFLALGPLWNSYQLREMMARLDQSDPMQSEQGLIGMVALGQRAIEPMEIWLQDPSPERRRKAALALSQIPGERAYLLLLNALQDRDRQVREYAQNGILRRLSMGLMAEIPKWEDGALKDSAAIIRDGTPELETTYREGLSLMKEEDWEAALDHWDAAIRQGPDWAAAYYQRAKTLYSLGRFDACLRDCQEVLRYHPDHLGVLIYMGNAYYHAGYWDLAYDTFMRTLDLIQRLKMTPPARS